jgi:hypothetical protein
VQKSCIIVLNIDYNFELLLVISHHFQYFFKYMFSRVSFLIFDSLLKWWCFHFAFTYVFDMKVFKPKPTFRDLWRNVSEIQSMNKRRKKLIHI